MDIVTAHRLAHEIEWIHAKDRARLQRGPGRGFRPTAEHEFDELAATCLGDLIHHIANGGELKCRKQST